MKRRDFLSAGSSLALAQLWPRALSASPERTGQPPTTFPVALAEPLRHQRPAEIAPDLARYKAHGYTGIWIEDDYVRWTLEDDPDQGFNGCWRLFNLFDFTFSKASFLYRDYLNELSGFCQQHGLDIWASFWVPLPNVEMLAYLRQHRPEAIGRATRSGRTITTLCTCKDGKGLSFLSEMVEQFLDQFPQVKGLKIATGDNGAIICDETCPNAHGSTQADHAGNLFGTIDRALHRPQRPARLMLYPWFWGEGFREKILQQLQGDYLVMTKMEQNSHQALEPSQDGDPIFDDSIVSEKAGTDFLDWLKRVGPSRIIDMVPVGSGVDDMFFNYPPYPGRIHRRLRQLRTYGVTRFLDYECGGHAAGSNEEAVAVFSQDPECDEATALKRVSQRLHKNPRAQAEAVLGWTYFDRGFGLLPIGLGDTGGVQFSGRFGFAWPMCLATPLVASAFSDKDRKHEVFWFSPYNFFTTPNSPRLQVHFVKVLDLWWESLQHMQAADRLENTSSSRRELVAVEIHVIGAKSVLNWCNAAALVHESPLVQSSWNVLLAEELKLTQQFQQLLATYPWAWANNCWHPMQTALHQKQLGFAAGDRDVFVAKGRILKAALSQL